MWQVNIEVLVFHKLRGYDIDLIMQEIEKFGQNLNVKAKNMGKYMDLIIEMKLNFIGIMEFI